MRRRPEATSKGHVCPTSDLLVRTDRHLAGQKACHIVSDLDWRLGPEVLWDWLVDKGWCLGRDLLVQTG